MTTDPTPNAVTEPEGLDEQLSELLGRIDQACAEVEERLREHNDDALSVDLETALATGAALDDVGALAEQPAEDRKADPADHPEADAPTEPTPEDQSPEDQTPEDRHADDPDEDTDEEASELPIEPAPDARDEPDAEPLLDPEAPVAAATDRPPETDAPQNPAEGAAEDTAAGDDDGDDGAFDLSALIDDAVSRTDASEDGSTEEVAKLDAELADRADNAAVDRDPLSEAPDAPEANGGDEADGTDEADAADPEPRTDAAEAGGQAGARSEDTAATPDVERAPEPEAPQAPEAEADSRDAAFAASDPPAPEVEDEWPESAGASAPEPAASASAPEPTATSQPQPQPQAQAQPQPQAEPQAQPEAQPEAATNTGRGPEPRTTPRPAAHPTGEPSGGEDHAGAPARRPASVSRPAHAPPARARSADAKANVLGALAGLAGRVAAAVRARAPGARDWLVAQARIIGPKVEPAALHAGRAISKPLERRPKAVRDLVGWVALGSLFWGACVWVVILFFREPTVPQASRPPAALATPESGATAPTTTPPADLSE